MWLLTSSVLFLVLFSMIKCDLSCIQAQAKLSQPPASSCNSILTSGDIFDFGDDNIKTYCDHNCSSLLMSIYGNITKACGGGVGPSGSNDPYFNLLKESCWNYNSTGLCLSLWKLYIYPIETGVVTNFTTSYQLCGQDYQRSRTNCTDNCKSSLTQILDKIGCCYDAIANIGTPFLGADMIRQCGLSIPSCTPQKATKKR